MEEKTKNFIEDIGRIVAIVIGVLVMAAGLYTIFFADQIVNIIIGSVITIIGIIIICIWFVTMMPRR